MTDIYHTSRHLDGVQGIRLAVDEWGHADDPLVVFLHGGGQTRHSWKRAGSQLAEAGMHSVTVDLRGHGDSDWSTEANYDLPSLRDDIVSVLTGLGGRATLVGASLGGLTALLVADSRPDLVERLVLVDVVTKIEQTGSERIQGFMQSAPDGFDSLEDAADAIAAYLPHRPRPDSTAGLRKNLRQRENGRWFWHWDPAMFDKPPVLNPLTMSRELDEAAQRLTIPVLLLQGALSDVVSDEGVDHFRGLVPQLQVIRLSGAAHTAAADDNDAFTQAVEAFVLDR
ncbi:alpha/beta fold hydrolase [Dietzia psychralcaliphila]|uniref:alpha/beta fold hydrolase n=1 Tax=Dietzia psychralcaliphila TaxID=139021 RepID=UPI0027DED544|nr:alpha/beta hydrolase [Dietzia psychralcaliphila]